MVSVLSYTKDGVDARAPLNIRDYGGKGDGITNDVLALNKTIKAAQDQGGRPVFIPPGDWVLHGPLTFDDTKAGLTVAGSGLGSTVLRWPIDLGEGVVAVDIPFSGEQSRSSKFVIQDLALEGPGYRSAFPANGTAPNGMTGVRLARQVELNRVWVRMWKQGMRVWGDHQVLKSVTVSQCYFGMFFPNNMPSKDDMHLEDVIFSNNFYSCIGIEGSQYMDGFYSRVHFSQSPYGIVAMDKTGQDTAIAGVTMHHCVFEALGNGGIYAPGRTVVDTELDGISTGFQPASGYNNIISGEPHRAWIDVGWLYRCMIDGTQSFIVAETKPALIKAGQITGLQWRNATRNILEMQSTGTPMFLVPDDLAHDVTITDGGKKGTILTYLDNQTCQIGDALCYSGYGLAPMAANTSSMFAGIAAQVSTKNKHVVFWKEGEVPFHPADLHAMIMPGDGLKPDNVSYGRFVPCQLGDPSCVAMALTAHAVNTTTLGTCRMLPTTGITGADTTKPTLGTNIVNLGFSYGEFEIKRDRGRRVLMGGIVSASAALAANTLITTVGLNFRPSVARVIYAFKNDTIIQRVNIGTDGSIRFATALNNADYVVFDGLSYDL